MKNIAIITGASSGIGKEFLLNMPKNIEVDEIWAIAREKNFLEGLKEESNLNIRPFSLDLEKETSLMKIKDLLEEEKPNIKLLINAAGFGKFEKSTNISLEDSVGMIKVNDMALTSLCLMAIPYMKNNSNIINIASVAAFQPVPYINVYAASKAYVLSFSRSLRKELSKEGIHDLTVCPFWTKTKFFDRAVEKNKVIKKYVVMYDPTDVVKKAYIDMQKKKSVSVYGFIANVQRVLCKLLPHNFVMRIWCKQQKLKSRRSKYGFINYFSNSFDCYFRIVKTN